MDTAQRKLILAIFDDQTIDVYIPMSNRSLRQLGQQLIALADNLPVPTVSEIEQTNNADNLADTNPA